MIEGGYGALMRELLAGIRAPGRARASEVRAHLDQLTKPRGSLGRLEQLALRLARIYGDPPPTLRRRAVFVFAADHGVTAQGVSAYPSAVTEQMCRVLAAGRAGINAITRATGSYVVSVDIGVDSADTFSGIVPRRVRRGTRDLSQGAALQTSEVETAIGVGYIEAASRMNELDIVGIGELGIGNTTTAAALTAALLRLDPAEVVGRGTGIDDATLSRKRAAVRAALARLSPAASAQEVLAEVGGLEITGLVGVILAAAQAGKAVVLDGFVASSAALAAVRLNRNVRPYLFAAHRSPEPGHKVQLRAMRLRPLLNLEMRLGEGTGAALAFPIIDAAGSLLREMATFADAGISSAVTA